MSTYDDVDAPHEGTVDVPFSGEPLVDAPETLDQTAAELIKPDATGSPRLRALRNLFRNKSALLAVFFLIVVTVAAIFAPLLAPYDPNYQQMNAAGLINAHAGFSLHHLLGTDYLGRDIFSRLIYGARVSLAVAYCVVGISLLIAVPIGLISGYWGGLLDNVLMRFADAGLSFPPLVLALAIAAVLGPGVTHTIMALIPVFLPGFMRFTRGQTLAVRQEIYVDASRSIGTPTSRILFHRVLPNVQSSLFVTAALSLGGALLAEAGLSFLGVGVRPPTASWGNMIQDAYNAGALFTHPSEIIIPALAIVLTVLAYNTLADGMREALGPTKVYLKRRDRRSLRARHGLTSVLNPSSRQQESTTDAARSAVATTPASSSVPPDKETVRTPLVSIENLSIGFRAQAGMIKVVDSLYLDLYPREVLGLVGESGSGKTVTSLALMRLLPSPPGVVLGGSVRYAGRDLLSLPFDEMRRIRGAEIGMVFQDPVASLNPTFTIGDQLIAAVRAHQQVSRVEARRRAAELLEMVRIPDPVRRLKDYPHELSGGTCQRVVLAIALASRPKLLIADEPTTALDVTVQAEILDLLRSLQQDLGMAALFVTHDLGIVAEVCDRVAVMYAGQIVEQGTVNEIFNTSRHPYTRGLMEAMPQRSAGQAELTVIPGQVPVPQRFPSGCRFHPRCQFASEECRSTSPELLRSGGQETRCMRAEELFPLRVLR